MFIVRYLCKYIDFQNYYYFQDDSITDDEAIKKYHDYKSEFKRTELHNFFVAHKDEEWLIALSRSMFSICVCVDLSLKLAKAPD